jgi:hypothetical protein
MHWKTASATMAKSQYQILNPDLPAHDAASLTGLIAAQAHEAEQPARRFTAWSLATLLRRSMSCAKSISKCPEGFIQILDAFGYGRDAVCAILEIIPSRKFRSLDRAGCAVRECVSIVLREGNRVRVSHDTGNQTPASRSRNGRVRLCGS